MTRLIDADTLAKVKFHGYPEIEITPSDVNAEAYKRGWNDAIDAIIENGPSIDAVPVIRCKDCKHRYIKNDVWTCPFGLPSGPDGYCSYGERREE